MKRMITLFSTAVLAATVLTAASPREIHEAAARGDAFAVKTMLSADASAVNLKNATGETPLHWACIRGHRDVVRVLIEAGADVNVKTSEGWTPLHWAALKGQTNIAILLIDNKADLNAVNKDRWTPMHVAAFAGELDMIKLLIDKGADIRARDRDGFTPMQVASEKWRMVMELLGGRLPDDENPDALRKRLAALDKEAKELRKAATESEKIKARVGDLEKQLKDTVAARDQIEKKLRSDLAAALADAGKARKQEADLRKDALESEKVKARVGDLEKQLKEAVAARERIEKALKQATEAGADAQTLLQKKVDELSALNLRCKEAEERAVKQAEAVAFAKRDAEEIVAQNAKQLNAVQKRITELELELKKAGALREENARVMRANEARLELAWAEGDSLKAQVRAAAGWDETLREQKRLNEANTAEIQALRERNKELESALEAERKGIGHRDSDLERRCRELESWVKESEEQVRRLREELDLERRQPIRLEPIDEH